MNEQMKTALQILPRSPLTTIDQFANTLAKLQGVANLVLPLASLDYIPPMTAISLRIVKLDHTIGDYGAGTDVYKSSLFCKKENERALSNVGLLKLWAAAGGSIVDSRRTDDRSDRLLCAYTVTGQITQMDGQRVSAVRSREVDLRPGSPQLAQLATEAQQKQAQAQITQLAESKATLRVIRAVLAIKQKYTVEELDKPFVIPVLVPFVDTSDPEIRRMLAAKQMGIVDQIYGGRAGRQALGAGVPIVDVMTGEVIDLPDNGEQDSDPAPWEAEPVAAPPTSPTGSPPAAPVLFALPVNAETLATVPEEALGGTTRRAWVARMNTIAIAICSRDGDQAGAAKVAAAIGTVNLLTASEFEMVACGKALQAIVKGGAA